MNDELQNKLGVILDLIVKGMTTVGDFVMDQLPDIARQYVMYGRVWNTAILVLLTLMLIYWLWNIHKVYFSERDYSDDAKIGLGFLSVILALTLVPATWSYGKDAALVWFAPKIWLIQEAADLMKPSRRQK